MEVSAMDDPRDEYEEERSLVQTATSAALFPLRVATSPPLLRTYLRTLLLLIASTILFAFAVIAYTSFYYSYVPVRGISVPVYLQFDHGTTPNVSPQDSSRRVGQEVQRWPHAVAGVKGLVNRQKYDVSVEMVVPRSRSNLRAGNWMLDLSLRSHPSSVIANILGWDDEDAEPTVASADGNADTPPPPLPLSKPQVLAHSRRPAILTYRSWPTEHIYRALRLPLYLTGFGTESETLHISMLEAAYFASSVPSSLRLELRSSTPLEIYAVRVHIRAKLEGLRWLMYQHRLASAGVMVLLFWATEMGVLLLTWAAASVVFGSGASNTGTDSDSDSKTKTEIKSEPRADHPNTAHATTAENDPGTPHSDTSHTFPTLTGHAALRYSSPGATKTKKEEEEESSTARLEDIPLREDAEAEADDEDDDFVLEEPAAPVAWSGDALFTDSGLGTGMDSERDRERERLRRRGSGRAGRIKDEGGR
ncbi:hypothetical protein E8E13_011283 [Curvularia kusanoi]|uniref:Seipin n=1 Tax=Curvularia kusanoi TaxID=90978 RepID=A0A9P4TP84_CURKU|nr:hypothetical protein E8E13_011283 [Curvularia kusanoi]